MREKNTSDTCICRILTGKTILSADCNIIIHTTMPQEKGIRAGWVREQVRQQQAKRAKRPIPDEFDHLYGSSQW